MKVFLFILISSFLNNCSQPEPDFSSEVRNLFYGADFNSSYEALLKHFNSLSALKADTSAGWTIYPPLSALKDEGKDLESSSFTFTRNEILPSGFELGTLTVDEPNKQPEVNQQHAGLSIYLKFSSKEQALVT